jgi:hypothetical protein
MKYTPGPWHAVEYAGYFIIQNGEMYGDRDLQNLEFSPNAEANAKLMASAPDLLDALEVAYSLLQRPSNESTKGDMDQILSAIKKATK